MITTETVTQTMSIHADSPESRRYNRIKRWMGFADFAIGFGLLVVLLATGWTGTLRDLAERGASQNYTFAVFLYVLMLMLISKVMGLRSITTDSGSSIATIFPTSDCAPGFGTNARLC